MLKKTDLRSLPSLNYYYNSKRGLLEKTEADMTLEEMYCALDIHKLSADFKMNSLRAIASSFTREKARGPVFPRQVRRKAEGRQEKRRAAVEAVGAQFVRSRRQDAQGP